MSITKQFLNYTFVAVNTPFLIMPTQKKKKAVNIFCSIPGFGHACFY